MNQNNDYTNNKRTSSAITFIKKTLVVVVLPIITAVAGAIAGKIYEKKSSEAALAEKIADELDFINENRNLARVITEIKDYSELLTADIEKYRSEAEELNEKLSGEGNKYAELEKERDQEKKEKDKLKNELEEYNFFTPKLIINGNDASINNNDLLIYKNQFFFGASIMNHFFDDKHLTYTDGMISINTEGTDITINPRLTNGVDLLSMEETHRGSYIGIESLMDNQGIQHNKAVWSKLDDTNYVEFRLDKAYHWFQCNAFVTKEATDYSYNSDIWDKASITVTADNGVFLWGTTAISRESEQQASSVIDITGVKYIRITFYNAGSGYSRYGEN